MTEEERSQESPRWGPLTKMVVGLTIIAFVAALLVQFRQIIGPLILAFMLAYLLYPLARWISESIRISWRAAVNLIYLVVVILAGGLLTVAGLTIVQQIQYLFVVIQEVVTDLPELVSTLSTQVYTIGPFSFNIGQTFDLTTLTNQLLNIVRPLLGQVGSLIGTFAGSAAVTIGWGLFVLLISYFLLADATRFPNELVHIDVPGYRSDVRRLGQELRTIWNTFLRGQLTIIVLVIIAYTVLMFILGVRYAIGLAILAGLARFVPYVGPLTTSVVTFLVTFLQDGNYFDLPPIYYALLVLAAAFILDQIFDNLISPRVLGQTLGIHPAALLVAAIVATNLIGIIGLVLAAPVLATLILVGRYVIRKLFDLDPFTGPAREPYQMKMPWDRWFSRLRAWGRFIARRDEAKKDS